MNWLALFSLNITAYIVHTPSLVTEIRYFPVCRPISFTCTVGGSRTHTPWGFSGSANVVSVAFDRTAVPVLDHLAYRMYFFNIFLVIWPQQLYQMCSSVRLISNLYNVYTLVLWGSMHALLSVRCSSMQVTQTVRARKSRMQLSNEEENPMAASFCGPKTHSHAKLSLQSRKNSWLRVHACVRHTTAFCSNPVGTLLKHCETNVQVLL